MLRLLSQFNCHSTFGILHTYREERTLVDEVLLFVKHTLDSSHSVCMLCSSGIS